MKRLTFRSTTALMASLSLAVPHQALAQSVATDTAAGIARFCAETAELAAETAEQQTCLASLTALVAAGQITLDAGGMPDPAVTVATDGSVTLAQVAEEQPDVVTDAPAQDETREGQAAAEAEAASEDTAEAVEPEAATGAEPDAPASETAGAGAEPAPEVTAETPAEDAAAPTADDTAATDPVTPTEDDATATAGPATTDDAAADPAATPAEPAEGAATAEVETETPAEPAEGAATAEVETETPAETAADTGPAEPVAAAEGEATTATEATDAEPAEAEVVQEDTTASTQAANETTAAAAAAADEEPSGEVVEEVITEENTRSSSEEFKAPGAGEIENEDDSGLSRFEKFALGALAAGAAGLLLKNKQDNVVSNSGDRVVVQRQDGNYYVLKDDDILLRRPGSTVATQDFSDGSSRQTITRADGTKVVTIRAANGQALRRTRIMPDGTEVVLFDDTVEAAPVRVEELPEPSRKDAVDTSARDTEDLRAALRRAELADLDRVFTLQQIREIRAVRELVPEIEVEAITFSTGSAAIEAEQAEELRDLGLALRALIDDNPFEVFLIEGHTDAVGSASSNLVLSDRRAESVALALTEYFDVPPENLVAQGYGEANLKVLTQTAERANRRATVRRVTPLLRSARASQ